MRVIKFPLQYGLNTIAHKSLLEPRHVEWQDRGFVVWCQEYTQLPQPKPLLLTLALTGQVVDESYNYITTAQNPDRDVVVHLFKC